MPLSSRIMMNSTTEITESNDTFESRFWIFLNFFLEAFKTRFFAFLEIMVSFFFRPVNNFKKTHKTTIHDECNFKPTIDYSIVGLLRFPPIGVFHVKDFGDNWA